MKAAILTILLSALLTLTIQQNINYLNEQDSSVTTEQLVDKFEELQEDLYKDVFRHFMT